MRTQKIRRVKGKTDYKSRKNILKSGIPRIVFRKTNKYLYGQFVTSKEAQDSVEISVTSKDLIKYGWPEKWVGSLKSLPGAYLTGFLLGKKVINKKPDSKAILDIGLNRNIAKSRIYSFLKGIVDSGIKINCDKKMFPEEQKISGMHMKKDIKTEFDKIIEKINKEIK